MDVNGILLLVVTALKREISKSQTVTSLFGAHFTLDNP